MEAVIIEKETLQFARIPAVECLVEGFHVLPGGFEVEHAEAGMVLEQFQISHAG